MQNSILTLTVVSLALAISACQPTAHTSNTSDTSEQTAKEDNQQAIKTAEPKTDTVSATRAKTCMALNKTMQKIDSNSQIEAIYEIQDQLKACLPTANNTEVLALLKSYQALYSRFLGADIYMDDEDFYGVVEAIDANKKLPEQQLAALSPRIQYLVKLVESKAGVSLLYTGEGIYVFHHDLQKMAAIFSPFLAEDQQAFIQRMAQDNQDIFWNDGAVAVPFNEVVNRAIFWQEYIQRYPKSYFIQDAKHLFALYHHVVFFGSNNSSWTNDAVTEFVDPDYKQAIQKLAKRDDSTLTQDARTLLEFMALSDSERQQTYPVPEVDDEGYEIQDWAKGRYQLRKALPIPSPWEDGNNRDCMSGITCVDYEVE